jgi:hypothetical protein
LERSGAAILFRHPDEGQDPFALPLMEREWMLKQVQHDGLDAELTFSR